MNETRKAEVPHGTVPGSSATDLAFKSPAPLFAPPSIAIVGASERAKWPTLIYRNLRDFGYPGTIYPVNPRGGEVWGLRCYPDLASLPKPPDHALVIVPALAVQGVLETGVAAGLKSATIYASQIGEGDDPEIIARGTALKALIERSGLLLCGPNCMGIHALREKNFGYPNADLCGLEPGAVAFVTQSGGTVQYLAATGAHRGVHFNYLISSGNELSLDLADYVNHFAQDESTRVIALFIEGIRRPQAFMAAAAKALATGKPIIAMKTGKSQRARDSAQSHTGAIAGDYSAYTAMCERYGIVTCPTLDDMVETLLAFQAGRLPKGPRVGFVTTSGGTVDLLYDYVEEIGGITTPDFDADTKATLRPLISPELTLKNPLDAGNPSGDAADAAMCIAVANDPNVDMLAWAGTPPGGTARARSRHHEARRGGDRQAGGGLHPHAARHRQGGGRVSGAGRFSVPAGPAGSDPRAGCACVLWRAQEDARIAPLPLATGRAETLDQFAQTLERKGLPAPRSGLAATPAEAAVLATRIGFPVALKIASRAISHKTEAGGVRLNLATADAVERASEALIAAATTAAPGAAIDGLLVQEMVEGTEIIVGARTDPLYGPMLVVGAGGILVELIKDVSVRLLPVTPDDVRAMLAELKVTRLLQGFRGRPPADIETLVRAICGLADVYLDHRHLLHDLEINPLIVCPDGVRAVDVRMVRASP